jgi:putative transposase
LTLSYAQLID